VLRARDHCQTGGFSHVRLNTNFLDGAGGLLSLGAVTPHQAHYRCATTPSSTGGLGVDAPPPPPLGATVAGPEVRRVRSRAWGFESGYVVADECSASDAFSEVRLEPRPVIDPLIQLVSLGVLRPGTLRFRCHDFNATAGAGQ